MPDEYQKVAALLSLDIQTMSMAVTNNPHLAVGMFEKLEANRQRLIRDVDWRDMRYAAAVNVFTVATGIPDAEESGEL